MILRGDFLGPSHSTDKTAIIIKVSKKAKIEKRCNQVPHLTQDTTLESDKSTSKHHIQESQEVSPLPAGDNKAAMNSHNKFNVYYYVCFCGKLIVHLNKTR